MLIYRAEPDAKYTVNVV